MKISLFNSIICCSLIVILSSCNSTVSKNSTINQQAELLTEFNAALSKSISLNGSKSETLNLVSDSIKWPHELFFLSYLDQLGTPKFTVENEYRKDSSLAKTTFTPMEDKNEIKKVIIDYKKSNTAYLLETQKTTYLMASKKSINLIFKNYGDQKILESYKLNGYQTTENADTTFYDVKGRIVY